MRRCDWVNPNNPLYVAYHDNEWGRPVHDDTTHFEMLTLEGAQAGLSWETILKKREHYRAAFAGFEVEKIARFTKAKVERLLDNPGIVRNRLKVTSTVSNAKAFIRIQEEEGSFDRYIWSFFPEGTIVNQYKKQSECPSSSTLSDTIAKDLKKRGFRFVGTTIIYAYMQAIGLVDDHLSSCWIRTSSDTDIWSVYMVRCHNGSVYTGIAKNVKKRFSEHEKQGKLCAKSLRGKDPLALVFSQVIGAKGEALKIEARIKQLSKERKENIIKVGKLEVNNGEIIF